MISADLLAIERVELMMPVSPLSWWGSALRALLDGDVQFDFDPSGFGLSRSICLKDSWLLSE